MSNEFSYDRVVKTNKFLVMIFKFYNIFDKSEDVLDLNYKIDVGF